jgi:hypothetical protein
MYSLPNVAIMNYSDLEIKAKLFEKMCSILGRTLNNKTRNKTAEVL